MKKVKLHGFTLIELIIVLAISGIIVASSSELLLKAVKGYMTGKNVISASWQANLVIERMTRDLHEASSVISATNSQLIVKDIHGDMINYKVDSKQLLRNVNGLADNVLADKVKDITFIYYDASGVITNDTNAIRYVGIKLTLIYTEVKTIESNFSALVYLWNIK
ncbi:conserved hypothetical protein [Gammaproteobacteria bacterium]